MEVNERLLPCKEAKSPLRAFNVGVCMLGILGSLGIGLPVEVNGGSTSYSPS